MSMGDEHETAFFVAEGVAQFEFVSGEIQILNSGYEFLFEYG